VNANNASTLAATLERDRKLALLFRDLATLRVDIPVFESVDELEWKGPTDRFAPLATLFDSAKTESRTSQGRGKRENGKA
jgi:hypothetical protein